MERKPLTVCIVAFPIEQAFLVPLSNLEQVIDFIADQLYLVVAHKGNLRVGVNRGHGQVHEIYHKRSTTILARIVRYARLQVRIATRLARLCKNVDCFVFLMEGGPLLPMLVVKLLGRKVIWALPSQMVRTYNFHKERLVRTLSIGLQGASYALADGIIVCSPSLISNWHLEKHRDKISIAHQHFIDFNKFNVKKRLTERDNTVGYIGRFSEEKGTLNFVRAIPEILKEEGKIRFLVGGDGQLRVNVGEYLDSNNLHDKVRFVGWIPHDELPDCLNQLKLLVLPSYTEGLPNIVLEAMACGTPVLATPVGAIPDDIKDGETGFIMPNNSPECIARNVIRALSYPDLEQISLKGQQLVGKKYTYEAAVEAYNNVLAGID